MIQKMPSDSFADIQNTLRPGSSEAAEVRESFEGSTRHEDRSINRTSVSGGGFNSGIVQEIRQNKKNERSISHQSIENFTLFAEAMTHRRWLNMTRQS